MPEGAWPDWLLAGDASDRVHMRDPAVVAPELARSIVASGAGLVHLSEATHSLEDVYLQLVNEDVEVAR
jgi:ABC-2 type transport system ATP-binding protein